MNPGDLVDKTEQGLLEIRTRALRLAPRLRAMLIMIDGRQTVAQLQAAAQQAGAPDDFLEQLAQQGLIVLRSPPPRASRTGATTLPPNLPLPMAGTPAVPTSAPPAESPPPASPADAAPAVLSSEAEAERVLEVRGVMSSTVVAALGLRSYFFTLKLEHCANRADLLALLPEYEKLLSKARDPITAQTLAARLRDLLR